MQKGAQPGEPTSGYGVPTAPSSPFSAPIQRYDPMDGQAFSAPIQRYDPMNGQALASRAMYQSESAAAASRLCQPDANEDLRQQQANIAREPTSMQMQVQPGDPPRGDGVLTASSVPFSASAPPPYPERMGMNAPQNDYPYDIRGPPPMSHNYVQNENPRSAQGHAPGEPTSREHSAAHRNDLENTEVKPVSAKLLYPKEQSLSENQVTAANSSQMSNNQMPLANYPRSIQSSKEEDSNDDWDLSSILSYFSGTKRADTTTTEPASMPERCIRADDGSFRSSSLASPYLHATDMGDGGSALSGEGSAPFDEIRMEGEWALMRRSDDAHMLNLSKRLSQPLLNDEFTEEMNSSSAGAMIDCAARKEDDRCEKGQFDKTFVLLLLKYLEAKNLDMRQQAIAIIRNCGERREIKEPGYASARKTAMKRRLKVLVGEKYWKEAKTLQHLTKLQQESGSKVGLRGDHFDLCLQFRSKRAQDGQDHRRSN
ncbi:MAG: hypothetical protein SGBAC_013087 [Bacillariaceae sp.]